MEETIKKIEISSTFIVLGLCIAFLTACGGGESKEEIPMGRYAERDINLPGSGYEYMHSFADGGYYPHDNGAAIFAFLPRFYTDDELDVLETEEV